MTYLMVLNPKAKRSRRTNETALVAQASEILETRDIRVAYTVPQSPEHTQRYEIEAFEQQSRDVDGVIAVGGDGTVNIVASALVRYGLASRLPLGVLPYGTGNNLVRSYGLERRSLGALKTIRQMHTVRLDVGVINQQHYFINTSFGLFGYLVPRRVTKSLMGWTVDVLRHIRFVPWTVRIRYTDVEGATVELSPASYMVGVCLNTSHYGSFLHMAPDAVGDDGCFDVKLIRAAPMWDYPLMFTIMLTGRYQLSSRTQTFRARQLEIMSESACPFETDGDAIPLQSYYRVESAGYIQLIVPPPRLLSG